MMQWLTNRFHTNCLSTIKQLNENLDQSADVIKRFSKSESLSSSIILKQTQELEECKKDRDNLMLQVEEYKKVFVEDCSKALSRASLVVEMSNKLEESKKYAEDSKKIIENLNAQIIEAKATLDYILFEKDKEIAELKKQLKNDNHIGKGLCKEIDTLKKNMSPKRKKGSQ